LYYVTAFGRKPLHIKHEEIFFKFALDKKPVDELGRQQFFDHESRGIEPSNPTPYYKCLRSGKQWMHWLEEQIRLSYFQRDFVDEDDKSHPPPPWEGWFRLWHDWKGELHILKMLTPWLPDDKKPVWIYDETWDGMTGI
jgi:hypothetical protein